MLGTVALSPFDALRDVSAASGDQLVTLRLQHTPSGPQLSIEQDRKALHRLPLTADAVCDCFNWSAAPMAGCTAAPATFPPAGRALAGHPATALGLGCCCPVHRLRLLGMNACSSVHLRLATVSLPLAVAVHGNPTSHRSMPSGLARQRQRSAAAAAGQQHRPHAAGAQRARPAGTP